MDTTEIRKAMADYQVKRAACIDRMLPLARAAVSALKDHGAHNTARDLETELLTYEHLAEELKRLIQDSPQNFVEVLLKQLGRDT